MMHVYKLNPLMPNRQKVETRKNSPFRILEVVGDTGTLRKLRPLDPALKVDGTPLAGYMNGGSDYLIDGRPVDPETAPKHIILMHPPEAEIPFCGIHATLPAWYVCEGFKEIIESLEPGVHQFLRVDMTWKNGSPAGHRYLLNVCNRIAFIDESRSVLYKMGYAFGVPADGKVYVHAEAAAGKAMWRDKTFHSNHPWISAEAVARIEGAGLRGFNFKKRTIAPDGLLAWE